MQSPIVGKTRLTRQIIARLTDSCQPVEALSYEPLWEGIDFTTYCEARQGDFDAPEFLQKVRADVAKSNITLFDKYLIAVGAAREYHSRDWESQSILGISTQLLNTSPPLLLRDSTSAEIFVCLFQLAKACGDRQLDQIIQNAWLTRIRSHQLSPIPAILLADDYACRDFLSATLYEYLITVEPLISSSRRIDGDSLLSYNQNLHIFQGYYSLSAYWTELCQEPLGFLHGQKCLCNRDCRKMWRSRWLPVACQLSPGCSPVDLLRRLWSVEKMMREDKLLCACMTKECKESALGALLQKRRNVSKNMYHYFDL